MGVNPGLYPEILLIQDYQCSALIGETMGSTLIQNLMFYNLLQTSVTHVVKFIEKFALHYVAL